MIERDEKEADNGRDVGGGVKSDGRVGGEDKEDDWDEGKNEREDEDHDFAAFPSVGGFV